MATKQTDGAGMTDSTEVVVPEVMTFGDIERMLLEPGLDIENDPLEAQKAIIARILNAKTEDEVFGTKTVVHARDMVGEPFVLHQVRMLESEFENEGLNIYAAMECTNENGEPFVLTCGAAQVIAQVFWAQTHNKLPMQLVVREKEKATKQGYKPLWLEFPSKGEQSF